MAEVKPVPPIKKRSFQGWFRYGNRAPMIKVFSLEGHLPAAISRFRLHCEKMGYRFISVHPHEVDLDEQEKLKLDNGVDDFVEEVIR